MPDNNRDAVMDRGCGGVVIGHEELRIVDEGCGHLHLRGTRGILSEAGG